MNLMIECIFLPEILEIQNAANTWHAPALSKLPIDSLACIFYQINIGFTLHWLKLLQLAGLPDCPHQREKHSTARERDGAGGLYCVLGSGYPHLQYISPPGRLPEQEQHPTPLAAMRMCELDFPNVDLDL